jgi:hypothetical protein
MMSTDDAHLTNDDLRYERTRMKAALADATARADAAEKDQHALRNRMMDAESRIAELTRLIDDVGHRVNTATTERDAAVARAEAAEKAQAELQEAEHDLLDESIKVARELGIDTDGDYDLIARAREVMSELATVRTERDTVERKLARVLAGELQHLASQALPDPKPHRVKQAGGRDLGVLVGHVTESGLFRVTSGPLAGAVYGCLYSAEPIDRPVLGEPTPDLDVWVRTCIDEVTPHNIHTADGGRFRRSEWGPARFAPVAKSTTSSAAPGEDDIPF